MLTARRRVVATASAVLSGALLLAFFAIIIVPFLMNTGVSFTEWQGVGTPKWAGLANYRELMGDSGFWASFWHSLFMVVAMAAVPTVMGLVLVVALFDFVGKHFGTMMVAVLRACFHLPQVLPIAVAGIVWSWILAPESGSLNELLKAIGLGSLQQDWLGDPDFALYSVMGVMVWVQIGFPLVIFMAGLQRVDPQLYEAAELDGAGWWRRFWHVALPQIRRELCIEHPAGLGHQVIGLVGSPPEVYVRETGFAQRVVQGFTAAADRNRLSSSVHPCEATPAAARQVFEQILRERTALTGVVVHNEPILEPLIDAFEGLGLRVPGDLSVRAICPDELAERARVPVTSIGHTGRRVGAGAVAC